LDAPIIGSEAVSDDELAQFGDFIRRKRVLRKLGTRAAARQIGIAPATLNRIERGLDSRFTVAMDTYRWARSIAETKP
jgi:transcriptional regulator with XRE-family HTH domain